MISQKPPKLIITLLLLFHPCTEYNIMETNIRPDMECIVTLKDTGFVFYTDYFTSSAWFYKVSDKFNGFNNAASSNHPNCIIAHKSNTNLSYYMSILGSQKVHFNIVFTQLGQSLNRISTKYIPKLFGTIYFTNIDCSRARPFCYVG